MSAVQESSNGVNTTGNVSDEKQGNSSGGRENGSERRRKRRWGDASAPSAPAPTAAAAAAAPATSGPLDSKAKALALQESIRARLAALKAKTGSPAVLPAPKGALTAPAASLKRPPPDSGPTAAAAPGSGSQAPPSKRAKHYELDMSVTGPTFRSKLEPPKPKVNPYLAHREEEDRALKGDGTENQAQQQQQDQDLFVDERLEHAQPNKNNRRRQRKELHFVEPGTFVEVAERKRQRAANAQSAGFVSGRKAGQYFQSHTIMANIYGTTEVLDQVIDLGVLPPRPEGGDGNGATGTMPLVVEWWDMELLPPRLKKQVANYEGKALSKDTQSQMQRLSTSQAKNSSAQGEDVHDSNIKKDDADALNPQIASLVGEEAQDLRTKCMEQASLSYSKTAGLIQHIVPVKPPNVREEAQAEPVLHLTKRELKRQRKLRRQEKLRELQDLQAAGLATAPEPRLTLKNFIRVLGDQAYVDPSQMEQKVTEQVQARQRAHLERNETKKLTKEQLAEKRKKKLHEDTGKTGVHVALFFVKNLSHPYHRTKVDLNAQQYNITGGVVECETPKVACVICEGGPKAIKKYIRLMTVRMKWKGPDNEDDDGVDDEEGDDKGEQEVDEDGEVVVKHKFDKENKCELVWTGMATKRFFKGFVFQACETSEQASKILRAKGVGHFWDQVLTHASGRGESLHLKLADTDDEDDSLDEGERDEEGDVDMKNL